MHQKSWLNLLDSSPVHVICMLVVDFSGKKCNAKTCMSRDEILTSSFQATQRLLARISKICFTVGSTIKLLAVIGGFSTIIGGCKLFKVARKLCNSRRISRLVVICKWHHFPRRTCIEGLLSMLLFLISLLHCSRLPMMSLDSLLT